jgi:ATP-binding cassette subfamily C protein CydCD
MQRLGSRLTGQSRVARLSVALVIGAGAVNSALAIAVAWVLSRVLAGAVQHQTSLASVAPALALVAALALGRGAAMWLAECAGHAGAQAVIADLRSRLLHTLAAAGPALLGDQPSGSLAMAATTGLDALDVYFARYLPQQVLGTIIPIMVLVFLVSQDLLSAAIVAVTLPLIPLFMWLIGSAAQQRIDRRWTLLQRLAAYFLDVIQGLPALRIFGRAEAQVERVRAMTEASRQATMGTLAIAFLSALVLETLASLSTALVAAEIGLRLVYGTMTLQVGFAVLIVVPEAYLPLRQLGTYFHASKDGLAAATTILNLIDGAPPALETSPTGAPHSGTAVSLATDTIEFTGVTSIYAGRGEGITAPLTLSLPPRTTTLVCGASGAGKSTLLALLVPFMPCTGGTIRVGAVDLRDVDTAAWRRQIGWVPQHPALFSGTVLDNIRLGAPEVADDLAASLLARLFPEGTLSTATTLTADGAGLSGGERTRIALVRAVARAPSLLLLDEPTSFLDPRAASAVASLLEELSTTTTLLIATHEPARFPWAHARVNLSLSGAAGEAASPVLLGAAARAGTGS